MKMILPAAALFVAALAAAACGSSTAPTAAPVVVVPVCESQRTATVYFQNRSASNLTYDIIWDGSKLTTVAPGKDSLVYTFASSVPHSLQFQFTNTNLLACSSSTPVLATCGATFYGCSS